MTKKATIKETKWVKNYFGNKVNRFHHIFEIISLKLDLTEKFFHDVCCFTVTNDIVI